MIIENKEEAERELSMVRTDKNLSYKRQNIAFGDDCLAWLPR